MFWTIFVQLIFVSFIFLVFYIFYGGNSGGGEDPPPPPQPDDDPDGDLPNGSGGDPEFDFIEPKEAIEDRLLPDEIEIDESTPNKPCT